METLNYYINEKLRISSKNYIQYNYHPKDKFELRKILEERLKNDKNANLNDIDVSEITDMGYIGLPYHIGLFQYLDPHNIDISEWDVSNVINMEYMLGDCDKFNCNLSNWDVSKVKDMSFMFSNCNKFNCNLSNWDVSEVENMHWMFWECKNFTGKGLENWNVSNVKDMEYMFNGCNSLKNKPSWYKE